MTKNFTLNTDVYKLNHWEMMPPETESVYSYFESRNGAKYNKTLWFGIQNPLVEHMEGIVVEDKHIHEGRDYCEAIFGSADRYNAKMWRHIIKAHGGRLPLRIRAVPEGSLVDVSNVLMTVEATDPLCAPLTNHCETLLSNMWYPCTVATLSHEVKLLCKHYLNETSDNPGHINFQLHDFGQRGVGLPELAALGGAGHLVNFLGTDTTTAIRLAHEYYDAPLKGLGLSVPATEHSIMTAMGPDGEEGVLNYLLDKYPAGYLSLVIDSYDYRQFINPFSLRAKDKILARDGKVVFRPDSGDPDATTLEVINLLDKVFGSTKNSKGYRVLNPKVGMLWGDGIDYMGIRSILYTLRSQGWASDNIVFGMGGGLLQKLDRDTQRFAFKSSWQKQAGQEGHDVFKKPLDPSKASKHGRLKLIKENGKYQTIREGERPDLPDQLVTIFENGKILNKQTFDQIRERAALESQPAR